MSSPLHMNSTNYNGNFQNADNDNAQADQHHQLLLAPEQNIPTNNNNEKNDNNKIDSAAVTSSDQIKRIEEYGQRKMDFEKGDELLNDCGEPSLDSGDTLPEEDDEDDDSDDNKKNHYGDISYRPQVFVLYSPPKQRQKWGETQILLRVNWGDLFFDLFYVAALYNISNIITESPNRFGALYSMGTFWPVQGFSFSKMYYDARYVVEKDDLFHRMVQIINLLILSFAVLAIRPVDTMANPSKYVNMFLFSLALVSERFLHATRDIEIYFFGIGEDCLKAAALREVQSTIIQTALYVAAAIVSGVEYFSNHTDQSGRLLATSDENNLEEKYESTTTINHVPIYLCLFGYLSHLVYFGVNIMFCLPGGGLHKKIAVPLNVDFVLHRQHELIMVNLGESVLSLLIVDIPNEGDGFYTVFYCGVLTVTFLCILFFRTQPMHAEHHAMRRHKNSGTWHVYLMHTLSYGFVGLGAAFTFFLIRSEDSDVNEDIGTEGVVLDEDKYKRNIAMVYCLSLANIFASLDLITLVHLSFKEVETRCFCPHTKKQNIKGFVLVFVRVATLIFTATMFVWLQDVKQLSITGLLLVVLQLWFRKLGAIFLGKNPYHDTSTTSTAH